MDGLDKRTKLIIIAATVVLGIGAWLYTAEGPPQAALVGTLEAEDKSALTFYDEPDYGEKPQEITETDYLYGNGLVILDWRPIGITNREGTVTFPWRDYDSALFVSIEGLRRFDLPHGKNVYYMNRSISEKALKNEMTNTVDSFLEHPEKFGEVLEETESYMFVKLDDSIQSANYVLLSKEGELNFTIGETEYTTRYGMAPIENYDNDSDIIVE